MQASVKTFSKPVMEVKGVLHNVDDIMNKQVKKLAHIPSEKYM